VKRGWSGPSWCVLARVSEEIMQHLFIECAYVHKVWAEVCALLKCGTPLLEGDLKFWMHN
jgi:hypothetical protein